MSDTWVRIGGMQARYLPDRKHVVLLPLRGTRCAILHAPSGKTYAAPDYGSVADGMRAAWDFLLPPDGEQAGVWRDEAGKPLRSNMTLKDHARAGNRMMREAAARSGGAMVQPTCSAPCGATERHTPHGRVQVQGRLGV
jgi:hypothetical protein